MFFIFSEDLREKMSKSVSFDIGEDQLTKLRDNLNILIKKILPERNKEKSNLPPNYSNLKLFGTELRLNLREKNDELLFWYGNILC